jgi:hypothetical protein
MPSLLERLQGIYGKGGTPPKTPTPAQIGRAIENNGNYEEIPQSSPLKKIPKPENSQTFPRR